MFVLFVRWIKTHDLIAFFALTFMITWSTWISVILTLPEQDFNKLGTEGMLLYLIGMWGPALAAILVTAFTRGKTGLKELFNRLKYRRGSVRWLLAGIIVWSAITLTATLWQARVTNQTLSFNWNPWSRILTLLISALPLFYWGCEEMGWRGFALPRLLNRWNALIASVILGLVWGFWHLPMFIWNIKGLNPDMPLYMYLIYTVSISIVMTWLLNHTHGSLLVAIGFHFWINDYPRFQYAFLPVEDPGGFISVISIWLLAAFAALIVVVYGYQSFNRHPEKTELAGLSPSKV